MPGRRAREKKPYATSSLSKGGARSDPKSHRDGSTGIPGQKHVDKPKKLYIVEIYSKDPPVANHLARGRRSEDEWAEKLASDLRQVKALVIITLFRCLKGEMAILSGRDEAGQSLLTKVKTFDLTNVVIVTTSPFFDEETNEPYWMHITDSGVEEIRRGTGVVEVKEDVTRVLYWLFKNLDAIPEAKEKYTTMGEVELILDWLWGIPSTEVNNSQATQPVGRTLGDVNLVREYRARTAVPTEE